ncbi:hypothetical protein AVEN_141984-1 [Araneus ventricosus]|uniref:Uncharacterized protein n=1 Tax=Araneus ventricosus TaxID=182803 RepID=A0A4Y2N5G3_ARAVE|nr:hypothetical protein AVEN_141984-1 [Araneus ventricosus]
MDYSPETLEARPNVISTSGCTAKEAEDVFVSQANICYKRKKLQSLAFSNEKEKTIATRIVQFSDFGFPVKPAHHKMIISDYLTKKGVGLSQRLLQLWWNWYGTSLCHGVYLYSVLAYEEASAKLRTRMAEKGLQ